MNRMNNEESLHGVGDAPSSGRRTLLTNAINTKVLIVYVARDILQVMQVSAVSVQYIIHQNVFKSLKHKINNIYTTVMPYSCEANCGPGGKYPQPTKTNHQDQLPSLRSTYEYGLRSPNLMPMTHLPEKRWIPARVSGASCNEICASFQR